MFSTCSHRTMTTKLPSYTIMVIGFYIIGELEGWTHLIRAASFLETYTASLSHCWFLRIALVMLPLQGLKLDPGGLLPKLFGVIGFIAKRSHRCASLWCISGRLTLSMLQLCLVQTLVLKTPSILPTSSMQKLKLLKMPLSASKDGAKWKQEIFVYTRKESWRVLQLTFRNWLLIVLKQKIMKNLSYNLKSSWQLCI